MVAPLMLGPLSIPAEPIPPTPRTIRALAEALGELGIVDELAPILWHVEMDAVTALLAGRLPGIAEMIAIDRHPLGMSINRVGQDPHVLVQRGLPPLAERSIIRHELCHWSQVRAGRCEVFDAGGLGRWSVMPAGSVQALEAGRLPPLEAEAERFGLDARYRVERAQLERTAPPGWTYRLRRGTDGRYEWQLGWRHQSAPVRAIAAAIDRLTGRRTGAN